MQQGATGDRSGLTAWDVRRNVRVLDARDVAYSRGYLRSRPEKWFPGLAAHWLPLAHSIGVELRLLEVKPQLYGPTDTDLVFYGSIDGETMGIYADQEALGVILGALTPGAVDRANIVVVEYMARRLLSSLAQSWSGPESSTVKFLGQNLNGQFNRAGAIKLSVELNNSQAVVWLILGPRMVDRLDGLWRRQIQSTSKQLETDNDLHIELAELAVPHSQLGDYLRRGSEIDLETPLSDAVTLKLGKKPWLPGRLCIVDNKFAVEVIPAPLPVPAAAEGTTRVSIELGRMSLDSSALAEIAQPGAVVLSDTGVSTSAVLNINGEPSGSAEICTFENRFAMRVL